MFDADTVSQPIPLELLVVTVNDDTGTTRGPVVRPKSLMSRNTTSKSLTAPPATAQNSKQGFAMNFTHLGRKGYQITLWSATWAGRRNWLEKIEARQNELRDRSMVFDSVILSEGHFVGNNRVTCAAPFGEFEFIYAFRLSFDEVFRCRCEQPDGVRHRQRRVHSRSS